MDAGDLQDGLRTITAVPQSRNGAPFNVNSIALDAVGPCGLSITKSELLFLCQLIILFIVIPILKMLNQDERVYLSLLILSQVLFGFASYPGIGQLLIRTRIALVLSLPFVPVALGIWFESVALSSCAILPLAVHIIGRFISSGLCRGGSAQSADATRFVLTASLALQGQLCVLLPAKVNFFMSLMDEKAGQRAIIYFVMALAAMVVVGVIAACVGANCTRRLVALMVLVVETLLIVSWWVTLPFWCVPTAFILLGLASLVKSVEKFRSREHRAARLVREHIGLPASAGREALIDQTERIVCNDNSQGDCPICLMQFEIGSELRRLPCGHMFCDVCIRTWLRDAEMPSCPNCRALVAPSQLTTAGSQQQQLEQGP